MSEYVHVAVRPPLVYLAGIVIGVGLKRILPDALTFGERTFVNILTAGLMVTGIVLVVWGWQSLARSSVDPNFKPVGTFVVHGPYTFTRNPMYLGFTILYIGISLFLKTFIPFLILPFIILYIQKGVIEREEEYLFERFGENYLHYKDSTRRWI